jgi:hypothetical protein
MPVGKPQKPSKAQKAAKAFRAGKRVSAKGAQHHAQGNTPRKTLAQQIKEHRQGGNR